MYKMHKLKKVTTVFFMYNMRAAPSMFLTFVLDHFFLLF
jgi:hypothetical protein